MFENRFFDTKGEKTRTWRRKSARCGATTHSITTFRIMTLSIMSLFETFSEMTLNITALCHAKCRVFIVMLSVVMLNVVMLNVVAPRVLPPSW
jgi:hypothetical protein